MNFKINWDAFGIATSVACAIHCAILPLFISSIPLFGHNIIDNNWFEYVMIALAFAVGTYSLYHGRKKHHHSWIPMVFFTIGMAAFILLIPLAVTSVNKVRRAMRPRHWLWLHRLVYLIAVLGVAHYYLLVKADHRDPILYGVVILALLGVRLIPRRRGAIK